MEIKYGKKRASEDNIILAIIDDVPRPLIGIIRPPYFQISLSLEGWVINNHMIDIEVAIIVIPRAVIEEIKLYNT